MLFLFFAGRWECDAIKIVICVCLSETIENQMRKLFDIGEDTETRLWNKYMSNTYEHLNKKENTVQDAGLYQGQVGWLQLRSCV